MTEALSGKIVSSPSPLRKPSPLRPGGHVAVLSISSPSNEDRLTTARHNLESRGLTITFAENLFEKGRSYLTGSDERRVSEINRFLRDDRYDAFLFSRGGYGAMRILEQVDYDAVARNPRPIIGYSDLTALHQAVAVRAAVGSFHGPMLNSDFALGLAPGLDSWFWSMLDGQAPMSYPISEDNVLVHGRAEGVLFGGCLSLSQALIGTPFDFWIEDGIWFWEDVSEPTYRVDRMLTHLRLSGRLKKIQGVMIGTLKECGENDSRELDDLLNEFFSGAGIPVIRDLPFGHAGQNLLLPIGALVQIDTQRGWVTFPDPVVDLRHGQ